MEALILGIRIFQILLVLVGLFFMTLAISLIYYFHTRSVPWVPTKSAPARALLQLARLKKGETVLDLGCGDGRLLVLAAREFGARGIGYEVNGVLVWIGRVRAFFAGCSRQVELRRADMFTVPIPKTDVVALYLFPEANKRLLPRLREALPVGTRLVSREFPIPDLTPLSTQIFEKETQYLYEL